MGATRDQWEQQREERLLPIIRDLMPGVLGSPYIPHWPHPPQAAFLMLRNMKGGDEVLEALYGGAAGGGKSDALLMAALQYVTQPDYKAILFRRTHTDLAQPGALMDRSMTWLRHTDAHWDGTNKTWRFPSGAQVTLQYLKGPQDHLRYQGAEYHMTGWDELTQFLEPQYTYVALSRVRRLEGSTIPLRSLSASNPGGVGHVWAKRRFVQPETRGSRIFVPATIADNPSLDQGAYTKGLMGLHPTVRAQLLRGDWDARDPGDYFRREWFGPLLEHAPNWLDRVQIRWWDLAATEQSEREGKTTARTAGVLMSRTAEGWYCVEHAVAFRRTPGTRDDLIIQQAQGDGHHVIVGLEIEPGSGGIAQYEALERRLHSMGFRVVGVHPTGDKATRCDPVASELENGARERWRGCGMRLVAGSWTVEYLDEVEGFPDGETLDLADATSGAYSWLWANAPLMAPPRAEDKPPRVLDPDAYADEEDDNQDMWNGLRGARRPGHKPL